MRCSRCDEEFERSWQQYQQERKEVCHTSSRPVTKPKCSVTLRPMLARKTLQSTRCCFRCNLASSAGFYIRSSRRLEHCAAFSLTSASGQRIWSLQLALCSASVEDRAVHSQGRGIPSLNNVPSVILYRQHGLMYIFGTATVQLRHSPEGFCGFGKHYDTVSGRKTSKSG